MQTDRGLVEHVEGAREAAPELGAQPEALHLAARERLRAAIEREVTESDARSTNASRRTEELCERRARDQGVVAVETRRFVPDASAAETSRAKKLGVGRAADADEARKASEPSAAALGARIGLPFRGGVRVPPADSGAFCTPRTAPASC